MDEEEWVNVIVVPRLIQTHRRFDIATTKVDTKIKDWKSHLNCVDGIKE